jgi:beta-lactam-binding protein with PASTA domain
MKTGTKEIRKIILEKPVLMHLISAIIVFFIIIFLALNGLNVYTLHNKAIVIPDVKGLLMADASVFLENKGLRYTVIDSVYTKDGKAGVIVETIPAIGSKVKKGRIIFITINAHTVQMATIPNVRDLSLRQGEAQIHALGFTSVEIKYVQGPYLDLIIGVELQGRELAPGEKVPLTSALILNVGNGGRDPEEESEENASESAETVE